MTASFKLRDIFCIFYRCRKDKTRSGPPYDLGSFLESVCRRHGAIRNLHRCIPEDGHCTSSFVLCRLPSFILVLISQGAATPIS